MNNRAYYDDFSTWYERDRGRGYHKMIDDLEVALVRKHGEGRAILEVGCGTGLILERVSAFAQSARGIDLSGGMLAQARSRNLSVAQGSATALPYPDQCFDVVYSYKVLAHVKDIRLALKEMARVTRPGGTVIAEFYNPYSLRYLVKTLKTPTAISDTTDDNAVFTRYDSISAIKSYLPPDLRYQTVRGIRIVTPLSHVHRIPGLGWAIRSVELCLADMPLARQLGGFLAIVCEKAH